MWSNREEGPEPSSMSKKLLSGQMSAFDIWIESYIFVKRIVSANFICSAKFTLCFPAPKISTDLSYIEWEKQTCDDINRLYRAIGGRV